MARKEKQRKEKERKAKKRKDYTFWHQFNEKPGIIPGCQGVRKTTCGWSLSAVPQCASFSV